MLELLKGKKILVVVAHPDDELLGLGATMNLLIAKWNVEVRVVILGEGITSRSDQRDPELWKSELQIHQSNVESARKIIGYHSVQTYDFPDNRFDSVPLLDLVKAVEKEKELFRPDVIFTHHGHDLNVDHQRTFQAVLTACRPLAGELCRTIITFETPSSTEWQATNHLPAFTPNFFISFEAANLQAKIDAMECYEFEKRKFPHPRSPEALTVRAQYWGVVSGSVMSEAFCLIRSI